MKKLQHLLLFGAMYLALFSSCHSDKESFSDPEVSHDAPDYSKLSAHPRLLLNAGEEEFIKELMRENPAFATYHDRILDYCEELQQTPPLVHPGTSSILACSREALKRIFFLSYAYRMNGDERYAARAQQELLNVSGFSSWNPAHFLDVAEMSVAVAIGYDWLYDYLSESSRATIRTALIEKSLDISTAWFNGEFPHMNNWGQVLNAGQVFAALAVYDQIPRKAEELIGKSIAVNKNLMSNYSPDGGYPEGYSYWGYGTGFNVMMIAAMESALKTDGGITRHEAGFLRSAKYVQFTTTPADNVFCYSDSQAAAMCNMMIYWFAWKTGDQSLAYLETKRVNSGQARFAQEDRHLPCLLIFAARNRNAIGNLQPPTDKFWYNAGETPTFVYRSSWLSQRYNYLGIKGGSPESSHAHMDGGSFFYENNAVGWAIDLGDQSYASYSGMSKWKVFRVGPFSHNTITVNGALHRQGGRAEFMETYRSELKKGAKIDLTSLLDDQVREAVRDIWLDGDDKTLTVVDHIEAKKDADAKVLWIMNTRTSASINADGSVRLTKNGHTMTMTVVSPINAKVSILSNVPTTDYDAKNPGTCRVGVETTIPAGTRGKIKVRLTEN